MSHIKLKICGLQSADEARKLADLGVDFIGLNFIPTSSRSISLVVAAEIVEAVKISRVQTVALFRDQSIDMVNEYARRLGIDYIQLHGDESPEYAGQVKVSVIRAIASTSERAADIVQLLKSFPADYFVLDRKQQGHGTPVDTDLANRVIAAAPGKIFLAGGLNAENLSDTLAQVQPYGIDIAGGVSTNNKLDVVKVQKCLKIIESLSA